MWISLWSVSQIEIQHEWTLSTVWSCFLAHIRRVWGSVLRADEAAGETRYPGGSEDSQSRLHRETEERFPGRGQHHGTVRSPQRHPPGGSCYPQWAHYKTISEGHLLLGTLWNVLFCVQKCSRMFTLYLKENIWLYN